MKKEQILKLALIFGGGVGIYWLVKKYKPTSPAITTASTAKSFDSNSANTSNVTPTAENAEIVISAYSDAVRAGESPSTLTELNKELTKEFGMRCYMDKAGSFIACDVSGNTILQKK